MELCIVGLNHRTTPLEFRERFALPADQVPSVLPNLRQALDLDEVVVLSTCNRLEVYCVSSHSAQAPEDVFKTLAMANGATSSFDADQLLSCLVVHRGEACIRHLFRVTSSLDSLVVGETEIVGQARQPITSRRPAGRRARSSTGSFRKLFPHPKKSDPFGIGRCSTSVGSVALDLANKIFGEDLSKRTILIVGRQ